MPELQHKALKGPVDLISVHSSGRCLAVNDGKNIFLEYGIPGEEVMYTSVRKKQGFRSGTVTQICSPSPYRIYPYCIHHMECGGCPWQHIGYDHQLMLKRQILSNALMKYNIDHPLIPDVIPSQHLHFFRHRVEYSFSAPDIIGFHDVKNPETVSDIRECYLQPRISKSICDYIRIYSAHNHLEFYDRRRGSGLLRSLSIRMNKTGEILLVIGLNEDRPDLSEPLMNSLKLKFKGIVSVNFTVHLSPSHSQMQGEIVASCDTLPFIFENTDEFRFRIHASSFYQPNSTQAENIFCTIREWACLSGSENVIDLYTGAGTIAHYLAKNAKYVTGIEGSATAVEDAKFNADLNGLKNIEFIHGDILETFTPDFLLKHEKPDLIVLDPPRSGTLIEIKKTINSSGAEKILYLSCNPVSLAYDLKQLTEVYRVTRIQPFDMIPHTHHLETLVMLEKK